MEIAKGDVEGWFEFYEKEFERIWENSFPVQEILSETGVRRDRSRILASIDRVRAVHDVVVNNAKDPLPYPKTLVVLPYMGCNLKCRNCYTWNSGLMGHGDGAQAMNAEVWGRVLEEATRMNISCLEVSGGGEPLKHPKIQELLRAIPPSDERSYSVGLLTNGFGLEKDPELLAEVRKLDYVRLGYTEALDDKSSDEDFWTSLKLLTSEKLPSEKPRIGVKLLLSEGNKDKLGARIERLLQGKVSHIKVKALRSERTTEQPSPMTVRSMEHQLASLREKYVARDLQVDLKPAVVKTSYKCWISPIMSVISANGDVLLCCNFYEEREQLKIGSLFADGELKRFSHFWSSPHHKQVMEEVRVDRVCNSCLGVDCRLVHYQELCEPQVRGARLMAKQENAFFKGHDKLL
jgi:pyruvate-formate lyase-activating enzyme